MKTVYRNSLTTQGMLYLDSIAITRYIFIFCLKNPAAFKNEFWNVFLRSWITAASLISNFSWTFVAERLTINFYICSGLDPTKDIKKPNDTFPFLLPATLITYIFVIAR